MYPVLVQIPLFGTTITIYTYGFMVAVAFLAGMFWVSRESKLLGQNPAKIMDLAFYIIVAAIVGSRVLHVLVSERARFLENPLTIFKIWEGGLVFYGGLIGAVIISVWYMRRNKLPFWIISDIFAPAVALGHVFGRIGCLMAGCCHGRVVGHPAWYSIVFPANAHSFAPQGVPLYPTQIMEAAGEIVVFAALFVLRRYKRFDGQIIATYLILYSILRAAVEYFRGDVSRGFLMEPWISTSTFISIIMFACGIAIYVLRWRKGRAA